MRDYSTVDEPRVHYSYCISHHPMVPTMGWNVDISSEISLSHNISPLLGQLASWYLYVYRCCYWEFIARTFTQRIISGDKNTHRLFIFSQGSPTVKDGHLQWYKAFTSRQGFSEAQNHTPTSGKTHVLWFWVQWSLHYRILPGQRNADNTWFYPFLFQHSSLKCTWHCDDMKR